jgi:hypothetical protein
LTLTYTASPEVTMLGNTFKESKEETVSCPKPSEEKVVGGGVSIKPGEGMIINESSPTPTASPTGWRGGATQVFTSGNQSSGKFKVWVICAR